MLSRGLQKPTPVQMTTCFYFRGRYGRTTVHSKKKVLDSSTSSYSCPKEIHVLLLSRKKGPTPFQMKTRSPSSLQDSSYVQRTTKRAYMVLIWFRGLQDPTSAQRKTRSCTFLQGPTPKTRSCNYLKDSTSYRRTTWSLSGPGVNKVLLLCGGLQGLVSVPRTTCSYSYLQNQFTVLSSVD